jgi:hypothetical protein
MQLGDYCRAACGAPSRNLCHGVCIWATDNGFCVGPIGDGDPDYESTSVSDEAVLAASAAHRFMKARAEHEAIHAKQRHTEDPSPRKVGP